MQPLRYAAQVIAERAQIPRVQAESTTRRTMDAKGANCSRIWVASTTTGPSSPSRHSPKVLPAVLPWQRRCRTAMEDLLAAPPPAPLRYGRGMPGRSRQYWEGKDGIPRHRRRQWLGCARLRGRRHRPLTKR